MHASSWERWESFWAAGERRGAVVRAWNGEVLTTRTAFEDGAGSPFAAESLLRLADDRSTWQAFRYRQEPGALNGGARREESGLDVDTLPASGEYLLVARMAAAGRSSASFLRVDEAAADSPPAPAAVEFRCEEPIDLPTGRSLVAQRFDVTAGGVLVARHWVCEGAVVRSAFAGALTFACASDAEALAGLDARIVAFLREGFAGPSGDQDTGWNFRPMARSDAPTRSR